MIKLIKISLNFPNNISYTEDLATVLNCFINNLRIYILDKFLYNYYQRKNSIKNFINEKYLDICVSIKFIEKNLKILKK